MAEATKTELKHPQLRLLERLGQRIAQLGVRFAVCDAEGHIRLLCGGSARPGPDPRTSDAADCDEDELLEAARTILDESGPDTPHQSGPRRVWHLIDRHIILGIPLTVTLPAYNRDLTAGAALIDLGESSRPAGYGPTQDAMGLQEPTRLDWLTQILEILAESFTQSYKADEQIEKVGTELSRVYEELVVLHRLSSNMKVTKSDASFLQIACDHLTDIVLVEGIAILIERLVGGERQLAVTAGSGLIDIDETMAGLLYSRLVDEVDGGKEALLDSDAYAPFKYDWPDSVRSIIAVPLYGKETTESPYSQRTKSGNHVVGLMVAVNRIDKPDFDSTDAKLLNSVAGSCAVFIENGRLFNDLKELFIGSLRALTNSIDAKDPYTRGHSERVAVISRWIAEKLADAESLDEEQIHRVYLSGLLHDIGKIGIDEDVLRKNGKLTDEEWQCIKRHPAIGASILRGIKQMRDIVPGVLWHHERIDGKGYPDGLTGEAIPLTGKIVGLADSFDAMTSKRTYRDAMSVEQALEEIRRNVGAQFDEKVASAFLEGDVYALWQMIQEGTSAADGCSYPTQYGATAVGALIR